jgi:nitroreductase
MSPMPTNTECAETPAVARRVTAADLLELATAAARAPSGDNIQPWRFVINEAGRSLDIWIDTGRDKSPMNAAQRMSLIACGAAVENALLLAGQRGWKADLELGAVNCSLNSSPVARVVLGTPSLPSTMRDYATLIPARVANRRIYDPRPVSSIVLEDLERSTPKTHCVSTHWIDDRDLINALADVIAHGDAVMFSEPSIRAAILSNIRFDLPPKACSTEGLPLASLEGSTLSGVGLRAIKRLPQKIFKLLGVRAIFSTHARKLVRSASGVSVGVVDGDPWGIELLTGRCMQRAWLALTELGFAAQPMMSLLVLNNAFRHGNSELIANLRRADVETVLNKLFSLLKSAGVSGQPVFLLRFGHAAAPTGRTGRRMLFA